MASRTRRSYAASAEWPARSSLVWAGPPGAWASVGDPTPRQPHRINQRPRRPGMIERGIEPVGSASIQALPARDLDPVHGVHRTGIVGVVLGQCLIGHHGALAVGNARKQLDLVA